MLTRCVLPLRLSLPLAIAGGFLVGTGQAPLGWWPATWVGVAALTWLIAGRRMRSAFGHGYMAGLAINALTVSWVSVLGLWVGIALVAFLSLWWGLLGVAISRITQLRAWPVLVPTVWVAMEFVSGRIPFGGFSWTRLGFTAIDQPLSGFYAWVGVAGVSYLVALCSQLALISLLERRWRVKGIAAILSLILTGGLLNWVPQSSPEQSVTIAVVQPNVNRSEHGTSSYARSVTNNALSETIFALAETRSSGHDLDFVLWPENATDVDPLRDPEAQRLVQRAVQLAQVPIFVGAVTDGPIDDSRQTTSLWWDPVSGPGEMYHKRNLVPFGEWIPFRDVLLPRMPILRQIGRQSIPGDGPGVIMAPVKRYPDMAAGTIICFELAYDETVYDVTRHGAEVLVSQSNTNTYATTFEPYQQLVLNRVRAMELQREVVVSTLNSFTALVDSRGQVHEPTVELVAAHRIVTVPLRYNVSLAVRTAPLVSWLSCLAVLASLTASLWRSRVAYMDEMCWRK